MLRYLDDEMHSDFFYLVMEYCPDGDLRKHILLKKNQQQKFEVPQVVEWSLQIASALKFCHDHKVIHRDVKVRTKLAFSSNSFFSPRTFSWFTKANEQS